MNVSYFADIYDTLKEEMRRNEYEDIFGKDDDTVGSQLAIGLVHMLSVKQAISL